MSAPTGTIDKIIMYDEYGEPVPYGITVDPDNIEYDDNISIKQKIQNIDQDISSIESEIETIESNIDPIKLGFALGTCSTAESNTAKAATVSNNFVRKVNGIIAIKFDNAVPADSTLSINGTNTGNIKYKGVRIPSGIIKAGATVTFMCENSDYSILAIDDVATIPTLITYEKNISIHHGDIALDMQGYTYNNSDIIFVYINGLFGIRNTDWQLITSPSPVISIPASLVSSVDKDISIIILKLV